jgi:hypothetical protein
MVGGRMSGDCCAHESIEGLQEHLAPSPTGTAGDDEPLLGSEQPLAGRAQARRGGRRPQHQIFAAPGHRRPARPKPLDERGEDRLTVYSGPLSPVRPGWP